MSYDTIAKQFTGHPASEFQCWCGISLAVPRSLADEYHRRNDAKAGSFALHCPMGHTFVPAGKSPASAEAQRLRDELAREKHRTEQAQEDARHQRTRVMIRDRQLAARKGQITKIKNRVSSGVCPCCNRYFANLHRHMTGQHPDWAPELESGDETPVVTPRTAPDPKALTALKVTGSRENWREMANRRRALGIAVGEAARAIGLKAASLRAYEGGSMVSLSAALRYATFLNDKARA